MTTCRVDDFSRRGGKATLHDVSRSVPRPSKTAAGVPQTSSEATTICKVNTTSNGISSIAKTKILVFRYNGLHSPSSPQNGTRLVAQRPTTKYSPPAIAPVNLTQHKEDLHEEQLTYPVYPRLFHPYNHFPQNPYSTIYQSPYTPIARPSYPHPPPLSPLETYSPTTPTASTFLSPPSNFSPPSAPKVQSIPKDKRSQASFKVPSGKEGSLKHRILTRPEDSRAPLDLQQKEVARSRLHATQSPPESPKKPLNNNTVTGSFAKGSLIRLANGDLRRVEDMRTEDFVTSAQQSPELRLADSTVVRIEENPIMGTATITLSYNQRRAQVNIYFVALY